MKGILLFAALAAISTVGAQAHIGWDLKTCLDRYGREVRLGKTANAGEIHYFTVNDGDMKISVILRNDKVKEIFYRKAFGKNFSPDEIDILQKKNQAELLGYEGIEWSSDSDSAATTRVWFLTRQDKPGLQSILTNQGTAEEPGFVLIIRTWDQIAVDKEAAKQDQLDKLKSL